MICGSVMFYLLMRIYFLVNTLFGIRMHIENAFCYPKSKGLQGPQMVKSQINGFL